MEITRYCPTSDAHWADERRLIRRATFGYVTCLPISACCRQSRSMQGRLQLARSSLGQQSYVTRLCQYRLIGSPEFRPDRSARTSARAGRPEPDGRRRGGSRDRGMRHTICASCVHGSCRDRLNSQVRDISWPGPTDPPGWASGAVRHNAISGSRSRSRVSPLADTGLADRRCCRRA
jgi:hypothetical protein